MSIFMSLWAIPVIAALGALLVVTSFKRLLAAPKLYADVALGLLIASFPFLFLTPLSAPSKIVLVVVHLWLLILPARLIFGRLEPQFIAGSTRRNVILGLVIIAIPLFGSDIIRNFPALFADYNWRLITLFGVSFLLGWLFLTQMLWTFRHYKLGALDPTRTLRELPTVSVCIPARNETHALEECLAAVMASDYPKLEVLVLDDCSQDSTSEIIRSFAHDGVRFIQGEVPATGWLGKNQAMQALASHAVGEYLLYMGVDTRVQPRSISRLMQHAFATNVKMVSVQPQTTYGVAASTVFAPLQAFWEVIVPITKRRVPVSSKMWLITAKALKDLGGFASVSRKVVPEGSFARRLFSESAYRFIISNAVLGVTSAKKWSSQIETSLRVLYPMLKREPMYVFMASSLVFSLLLAPFIGVVACAVLGKFDLVFWLSAAAAAVMWLNYGLLLARTQPGSWFIATICLPLTLVQEIILAITSMLQYEFGTVNWKGRNVCYPVIARRPFVARPPERR